MDDDQEVFHHFLHSAMPVHSMFLRILNVNKKEQKNSKIMQRAGPPL